MENKWLQDSLGAFCAWDRLESARQCSATDRISLFADKRLNPSTLFMLHFSFPHRLQAIANSCSGYKNLAFPFYPNSIRFPTPREEIRFYFFGNTTEMFTTNELWQLLGRRWIGIIHAILESRWSHFWLGFHVKRRASSLGLLGLPRTAHLAVAISDHGLWIVLWTARREHNWSGNGQQQFKGRLEDGLVCCCELWWIPFHPVDSNCRGYSTQCLSYHVHLSHVKDFEIGMHSWFLITIQFGW
jgi:hypothetical protein